MTLMKDPIVSVVIPTRNRPDLVVRAVNSALRQTFRDLDVVVVIDGPDGPTAAALGNIPDRRLRVIELAQSVRGAEARNIGAREARGKWIAFLDDDDEWMPEKIALQLSMAGENRDNFLLVSCRIIARTPRADYVWPRRFPMPGESMSDYLIARKSLFRGEGSVQTSTFLCRRDHFLQQPFRSDLLKHQDTEWVLRVAQLPGFELRFVDKVLSIQYIEEGRATVSSRNRWRYSFDWAKSNRSLFTSRAYSAFLLQGVAAEAAEEHCWNAVFPLLFGALKHGRLGILDFPIFCSMWLMPRTVRRRVRDAIMQIKRGSVTK
ncbi:MAG: glycosyltransferase family 2 protein [Terracidiphilus sp.]